LKKLLVTGGGGLLGSKLVHVLSREYEVTPTHNVNALDPSSLRMSIVDKRVVLKVFNTVRPDVVVHAAAETNVDRCETNKDLAWSVNATGTRNIAEACAKVDSNLIYISTDYVFDGAKCFYGEADEANPVNYYGFTKLKGEEFVKDICKNFVIARTSVLYGWHPKALNFATWVIDSLRNGRRISVVEDHYNSPTLVDNLAEMILGIVRVNARGVYHTAGGERMSRYEFAKRIAETFELDETLITPVKMNDLKIWIARRPEDSSLSVDKIRREIKVAPLDLTEALERMKDSQKTR